MPQETTSLMTAGVLAKELGVSDAKVKKALKDLDIQPEAKKGCCSYYGAETLRKLKATLK
jgi:hypothetical protein